MVLAAVEDLLELAWVAPLAVVVVAGSFSLCLLGATRATDLRRAGRGGVATAYAALGVLAGAVFAAAVVAGLAIIVVG
jgi:hypothetical protein